MRPARVVALVVGSLLALPALGMLVSGGALGLAYLTQRDDDGFFDVNLDRIESSTAAVTSEEFDFAADPGDPGWLVDLLDAELRLRVTGRGSQEDIFVGIASAADLEQYLGDVAHDEIIDVRRGAEPVYRSVPGQEVIEPPGTEPIWEASASGPGTQEVRWEPRSGRWGVLVMNADGLPRIEADVNVGARAGFVAPLALILLGAGVVLLAGAVTLLVVASSKPRHAAPPPPAQGPAPRDAPEQPVAPLAASTAGGSHPVVLEATLEPRLSRWLWLVKWFLAIPHVIVLAFLWVAFVVLTLVAGVSILFTGRYPRSIFDFNVGVLRWTWRVTFYASSGGLGTDTYPHFGLDAEPDDNARLDIEYPTSLSRPLVLVKWLLAVPHLIVVAILSGSSVRWLTADGDRFAFDLAGGGGLLGLLALAAGIMLLFTNRYPRGLFDLIVGLNRWIYRVIAYVALMTDRYPPFRLDQGGSEPSDGPPSESGVQLVLDLSDRTPTTV